MVSLEHELEGRVGEWDMCQNPSLFHFQYSKEFSRFHRFLNRSFCILSFVDYGNLCQRLYAGQARLVGPCDVFILAPAHLGCGQY